MSVDYVLVEPSVSGPIRIADPWHGRGALYETETGEFAARPGADGVIDAELQTPQRYLLLPEGMSLDALPVVDFAFGTQAKPTA